MHFNPRSREGSDPDNSSSLSAVTISIHAPARGATQSAGKGADMSRISIHAPARGATEETAIIAITIPTYFNPRSREGSDVFKVGKLEGSEKISIHAPARGATVRLRQVC